MSASAGPVVGARPGPRPASVRVPTGFGWSPSFSIREEELGDFDVGLDVGALRVATSRNLWVDIATGTDGAAFGTSPLLPLKSINVAINRWNVTQTIYVKAGWYPVANSWQSGVPFGANVNVIGVEDFTTLRPGRVVSSVSEDVTALAWADVGGGEWTAAVANAPYAVVDTSTTPPTWFTLAADANAVDAPGEYFYGAGTLRVATLTGAAPTSKLRVLRDAVHNGWLNTALDVTVENVTFEGGGNLRAFFAQHCGTLTFVDCGFELSEAEGFGLQTSAAGVTHVVHHIRTVARWNTNDGIQYTATGAGTTVHVLEWECEATANGRDLGSNQGSTLHFSAGNAAVIGIRVGGSYIGNEAQEVADVGGCQVWMLGCLLSGSGAGVGYYLGDASTAWLHGVVINDCANGLQTDNAAGVINVHASFYSSPTGTGTVQSYQA